MVNLQRKGVSTSMIDSAKPAIVVLRTSHQDSSWLPLADLAYPFVYTHDNDAQRLLLQLGNPCCRSLLFVFRHKFPRKHFSRHPDYASTAPCRRKEKQQYAHISRIVEAVGSETLMDPFVICPPEKQCFRSSSPCILAPFLT